MFSCVKRKICFIFTPKFFFDSFWRMSKFWLLCMKINFFSMLSLIEYLHAWIFNFVMQNCSLKIPSEQQKKNMNKVEHNWFTTMGSFEKHVTLELEGESITFFEFLDFVFDLYQTFSSVPTLANYYIDICRFFRNFIICPYCCNFLRLFNVFSTLNI